MLGKLIVFLWMLLAVGAIMLCTPVAITSLHKGDWPTGALFVLIQVPAYYFMLSVYFEHVLEKRFQVHPRDMPALESIRRIGELTLAAYCRSRREVLRDVLDRLNLSEPVYERLISVHEALGLACIDGLIMLTGWAILQRFVGLWACRTGRECVTSVLCPMGLGTTRRW